MSAWESPIIRVSSGKLNTVNDTYIGGEASIGSLSRYAGQLGKRVFFSPDQIGQMTATATGNLYGGSYRYVRVRSADAANPIIGTVAFWDTTATSWQTAYQVTSTCDLSGASLGLIAGVFISAPTKGNYCFIQDLGIVPVLMGASFTNAGSAAIGIPVYVASNGASPPIGYGNVIDADATGIQNVKQLGVSVTLPVVNQLHNVILNFHNVLG